MAEPPGDPGDGTVDEYEGDEREERGGERELQRVHAALDDELVDDVEDGRGDEHRADVAPRLSDPRARHVGVKSDQRQERRAKLARVTEAGADGQRRGHGRLHDEARVHGPVEAADEVRPQARDDVIHGPLASVTSPGRWRGACQPQHWQRSAPSVHARLGRAAQPSCTVS
jgi:hypothetical protein